MRTFHLYIGTYTKGGSEGIYLCERRSDGTLSAPKLAARTENPSYLALSPEGKTLFAVRETDALPGGQGAVSSFRIRADGTLERTAEQASGGAFPCHLCPSPDGRFLAAANYGSDAPEKRDAAVSLFPVKGGVVGPAIQADIHTGHGPDPDRQQSAHVHFAGFSPDGALRVADLGLDRVFTYPRAAEGSLAGAAHIALAPGSGPRHLAFLPEKKTAYLVNEMGGSVTCLRILPDGGLSPFQTAPALPPDFAGENRSAAVRLSPSGRLLAVSNRGHDSIALYDVGTDGSLSAPVFTPCGGRDPRDLAFSPDGRFLFAADESSGNLTSFAVDAGGLRPLGEAARLDSPVCLLFAPVRV